MSIFHAIILGIIQGVGEFLPISSSGHLVLLPYIFNWNYQGLTFDVALHFGTLLALVIFFWRDWSSIITSAIKLEVSRPKAEEKTSDLRPPSSDYPQNLFWIILAATVPAAILGYFLDGAAEQAVRNPLIVAILLAVFGLILWLVDYYFHDKKRFSDIGYGKGILIGVAQSLALFPGVSRSGVTATAGMVFGLDRQKAMRFSFLLGTPITLGAFLLKLKDVTPEMVNSPFIVAILTSAIFGIISIKFLLKFLEKHGFAGFAIYRLVLTAVIIILYLTL